MIRIQRAITFICLQLLCTAVLQAKPLEIVAAENVYGDLTKKLGGPYVRVTNILVDPNQDPHLFVGTSETIKLISDAVLIIYNDAGYDPWINSLITASGSENKAMISVASLVGKIEGDNPHIWYNPNTLLLFANAVVQKLTELDPDHQHYFDLQLANFKNAYHPLETLIAKLKAAYAGTVVLATEPVFNDMADALGLTVNGYLFQLSVMHDTEPRENDRREFEEMLTKRQVKLLLYNNQVSSQTTEGMVSLAQKNGIPVVYISETQPAGQTYVTWMIEQLKQLENALKVCR